jgi:HSP20 family protein
MTQLIDHRNDPKSPEATQPAAATAYWRTPAVDIHESPQAFLLLADLPGVADDAIDVRYARGELTIEARRAAATLDGRERVGFRRTFSVPGTIDVAGIRAELKQGVLHLALPKSEAARPREIRVVSA